MGKQKFTIFLLPQDEGGYQVFVPHYPECTTDGNTVKEALVHCKEAIEGLLRVDAENGGDTVPHYVYANHAVVGTVEIEVPEALIEPAGQPRE